MFHKYLKLILVSTALLQAGPKVFNSLGNELEAFQKDCKRFQKISMIPVEIKEECNTFYIQLNKAFEIGYKLDTYVDSDNINERALDRYLILLRQLDKRKENILGHIYTEASKARKENNFTYYRQLIANDKVELYASDYEFMKENIKIFSKNARHLHHKHIQDLEEKRLKHEKTKGVYNPTRKKKIIESKLPISLLEQVSPKAFNSLGNELEAFREDCKTFQNISMIPVAIQESCNRYYLELNKAFEVGYKLDSSIDQENINEKELHAYLFMLRHLDKRKEKILGHIYAEASKARKENNFTYYRQLIANYKVELYASDYAFMEQNIKIFSKNPRYVSHIKYIQYLEEVHLKKEKAKRVQYKNKE
ncbi:MAG: hypothetical protein OQK45_02420 [Sulfurovum sp.]|nr:hypothetical protein [Sulfurovum sp.]